MVFEKEQVITIENVDFYIVSVLNFENNIYLYVAEMDNDEDITGNFTVYRYDDKQNLMIHITESSMLKKLLMMFAKDINNDLKDGDK